MKLAHLRSNAIRTLLLVFCVPFFFSLGAQQAAPLLGDQLTAGEQSASQSKPVVPSKTQKVANPLNDLLEEAQRDIDKNNFESAIVPLQKVIADQPEFAYAHFQLAYVYTALKKTDEARVAYERTIALDPKMSEAYLNLGILLLDKQEFAAAVPPLRKAVDLLPAQSHPRYLLAVALDRSGDHAGAAEAFEALLQLDPNDVTAINYLGWAALRNGRPAAAEARFWRAVEIQPKEPEGHKGLAESLDAQKKSEAAAAYRDYLELMPNDAEARARTPASSPPSNRSSSARTFRSLGRNGMIQSLRFSKRLLWPPKTLNSTAAWDASFSRSATSLPRRKSYESPCVSMRRILVIGRTSAPRFFWAVIIPLRSQRWTR